MGLILLAADAAAPVLPEWVTGMGAVGGLAGPGFTVWFAYYVITRLLPDKEKAFAAAQEATERRHADHINMLISNFRSDLVSMNTMRREDDARLVAALEKLTDRVDAWGATS